jgi:hypothetical protein
MSFPLESKSERKEKTKTKKITNEMVGKKSENQQAINKSLREILFSIHVFLAGSSSK